MDWQDMFNIAMTVIAVLGGALGTVVWQMLRNLQDNYAEMVQILSRDYLRKDDYRSDLQEIRQMLNRILDKLDTKADKE